MDARLALGNSPLAMLLGFEGDPKIVEETKRFLSAWWAKKVQGGGGGL